MVQAAGMGKNPSFFVDWSIRRPSNDNGELLQHCGPWPVCLAKEKPILGRPFAFDEHCPGSVAGELKSGELSILRFDGDNGEYGMLMGNAKTILLTPSFTHDIYNELIAQRIPALAIIEILYILLIFNTGDEHIDCLKRTKLALKENKL